MAEAPIPLLPADPEALRDWGLRLQHLGHDLGTHRGDSLFGFHPDAYQFFRKRVCSAQLDLQRMHRVWDGYTYDERDSRHVQLWPALLSGYYWVGVENRYFDWVCLPTPVWCDDVATILARWGLIDIRWVWAASPPRSTLMWPVPTTELIDDGWLFASPAAEGDKLLVSWSRRPWALSKVRGGTGIMAMGQLDARGVFQMKDFIMGFRATKRWGMGGWCHNLPALQKEVLRRCAKWARDVVLREENPFNPMALLSEGNYAAKREHRRRASP